MASTLLPIPGLTALRLLPLLSSTCTLLYARDQEFFLSLLNRPDNTRAHSKRLLPPYFRAFFRQGVVFVVACLAVTTWGSVANLYVSGRVLRERGAWWAYVAAATGAVGHLAFVPGVAGSIRRISEADGMEEGRKEGEVDGVEGVDGVDVNAELDEWLGVNWWRMVTVDLGAWVACCVAVGRSLRA
ncbi:hypothetical protein GE09DRAFT_260300 [Coniochaeta sp. 2T2.1]|nr:hypothetical protein GE09DRAFT_260300 [Coniochaeta sp. 2T2.1]